MNIKANPLFNEMRQGFAIFKKETRVAQIASRTFEMLQIWHKFCVFTVEDTRNRRGINDNRGFFKKNKLARP